MKHLHFTQSLEPLHGGGLATSAVALHRRMLAEGVPSSLCATCGQTPMKPAEATFEFRRMKPSCLYYSPTMQRQASRLVWKGKFYLWAP